MMLRMLGRLIAFWSLFVALSLVCKAGPITTLDDIGFWVGSGANRAALLVDWDGDSATDTSLAWGYRWDGSKTGEDMLRDILAADSRLFAKLSAGGPAGIATYGIGYDENNDGAFAISDGTLFGIDGIAVSGPADLATSIDPADRYDEGWFLGFWHLGVAATNPFGTGSWSSAPSGISSLVLSDASWTSLAFTTNTFNFASFAENPIAAQAPSASADFDGNGRVEGRDFLLWQQGFGIAIGALAAQGDANGDGAVDNLDLQIWATEFGLAPAGGMTNQTGSAVPEPSSAGLLLTSVGSFLLVSKRRKP